MMKWTLLAIGLASIAWAVDAPSGKPEISIQGKSKQEAMDALAKFEKADGWTTKQNKEDSLRAEKKNGNARMRQHWVEKMTRREFKFTETNNEVHIACTVTKFNHFDNGENEDETDVTKKDGGEHCAKALATFKQELK